jgi:DNA-binding NarL/FixJ family response regulator
MSGAVAIRLDSPDPMAEIDVLAQLKGRPEVVIAGPQGRPAVALAVLADIDDEALEWLRGLRAGSGLPIVVVIGPAQPAALVRLVESGACGILGRGEATASRLVRAVQLAAAGQGDLPPALVRHLLDRVGQLNCDQFTPRGRPGAGITGPEREVLRLLADGMSTREVAARLAYPEGMVKGVVQDLMLRLNVRNRAQAVACAVRNGWV